MRNKRYAFTMLELIFVIVLMGILGKFGVEFLARAYDDFIFTKINNDLQSRSAMAVEFISKRLENRIKKSARVIDPTAGTWEYIHSIANNNAEVIEWIAADNDGFRGTTTPLWSGVLDLIDSNGTHLVSPGSNFTSVNTLINILGNSDMNDSVIYFIDSKFTDLNPWGYGTPPAYANTQINTQNKTLHPAQSTGTNNLLAPLTVTGNLSGLEVSEYYKLSWTANAVSMENPHHGTNNNNNTLYDLYFYYDYQPWQGDNYTNGQRLLLAQDISSMRVRSAGSLIKIQVCAKSDLVQNQEYALCKEKTVF